MLLRNMHPHATSTASTFPAPWLQCISWTGACQSRFPPNTFGCAAPVAVAQCPTSKSEYYRVFNSHLALASHQGIKCRDAFRMSGSHLTLSPLSCRALHVYRHARPLCPHMGCLLRWRISVPTYGQDMQLLCAGIAGEWALVAAVKGQGMSPGVGPCKDLDDNMLHCVPALPPVLLMTPCCCPMNTSAENPTATSRCTPAAALPYEPTSALGQKPPTEHPRRVCVSQTYQPRRGKGPAMHSTRPPLNGQAAPHLSLSHPSCTP